MRRSNGSHWTAVAAESYEQPSRTEQKRSYERGTVMAPCSMERQPLLLGAGELGALPTDHLVHDSSTKMDGTNSFGSGMNGERANPALGDGMELEKTFNSFLASGEKRTDEGGPGSGNVAASGVLLFQHLLEVLRSAASPRVGVKVVLSIPYLPLGACCKSV